jgi:hypothetical protein
MPIEIVVAIRIKIRDRTKNGGSETRSQDAMSEGEDERIIEECHEELSAYRD